MIMKRFLLTISYNGTAYHGWQIQPNGITVQEVLQNTIHKVLGNKITLHGCSRTDAGVHAKMFCCHLDCEDNIPSDAFLRGVNGLLPNDISITDCKEVESDFHARYNAKGKTYIYNIYNGNLRDPFKAPFVWEIERPLNTDLMNVFCESLVGKHDFYGFSSSGRTVGDTVRTVTECKVLNNGNDIKLQITGDGFLYNMVRIIVGTAVGVSDGRISHNCAEEIFSSKKRELAGMTAPSQGLFLEKVFY